MHTTTPANKKGRDTSLVYAWVVVSLLMVAYTLSFLDRQILALLVTDIQADLAISDTQIGLLQGLAFTIFYTTLGIPIARIADNSNRRNLIAIGVCLWSLMTILCGYAKGFVTLFLARMGVGVGEAALSPAAYSMITDYFPRKHLSKALSVYAMGVYIGGGIAFSLGGLLIDRLATADFNDIWLLRGLSGWQLAFIVAGLPGILVAAAVMKFVREPQRRLAADSATADDTISVADSVRYLVRNRRAYVPIYAGFSLHAIAIFAVFSWLPTQLIREFGYTVGEAGNTVGIALLFAGCAGVLSGGVLCDRMLRNGRFDAPLVLGLLAAVGTSLPFVIANFVAVSDAARTLLSAASFFFMGTIAGPAPAAIQLIAPRRLRAQLSAVFLFSINFIGMTLGPLLPAIVSDKLLAGAGGIGMAMTWVILASGVAATLVFVSFRADYRRLAEAANRQP